MDEIIKVALVTGASSGIGKSISKELVKLGYTVFGIARSLDNLLKVQNELKEAFIPIVCDTSKKEQVVAASQYMLEKKMFPSLFFLNAGMTGSVILEDPNRFDLELYEKIMNTNYFGVLTWIEFWKERCLERNIGTFIVTSSCLALFAPPKMGAYAASKAAIAKVFEGLSITHFKTKLKFSVAYPGPVDTPALRELVASRAINRPVFTMTSKKTAKHIINCALKGKPSCYPSFFYRTLNHLLHALPYQYAMKLLEKL